MSNGVSPGQHKNPKPPPHVVMGLFDRFPPKVRKAVRDAYTDIDLARIAELLEDYSADRIAIMIQNRNEDADRKLREAMA